MAEGFKSKTAHLDILGDSLRGRIPSLDQLFEDPSVSGALESILGRDYAIHPHNFVHKSSQADQMFHQDGNLPWNERGHYRSHTPDWALLFYYPQEVTTDNGPTEVILGTQYWTNDFEKEDGTWHSFDPIDRTLSPKDVASDDLVSRDKSELGKKFIILPNATDGHWVRAIFGESEPAATEANRRLLLSAATRKAWDGKPTQNTNELR